MGAPDDRSAKLEELGKRIRAIREGQKPKRRKVRGEFTAAHMAWRMTLELVVGGLIGAAMGWGLDVVLGTRPIFLIVFVLLGMAAGIRTALRSAEELSRGQAREEEERRSERSAERDENKG